MWWILVGLGTLAALVGLSYLVEAMRTAPQTMARSLRVFRSGHSDPCGVTRRKDSNACRSLSPTTVSKS